MKAPPGKLAGTRLRQGFVFVVGAVAFLLVVGSDAAGFDWTPLALGAVYLAAAALGGRDGGHWSTACVLLGFGAAVLLVREGVVEVAEAPVFLVGAGAGGLLAAGLERGGFTADLPGVAGAAVAVGLVFALAAEGVDVLTETWPYAALLAVVGAVNLGLAFAGPRRARRRR